MVEGGHLVGGGVSLWVWFVFVCGSWIIIGGLWETGGGVVWIVFEWVCGVWVLGWPGIGYMMLRMGWGMRSLWVVVSGGVWVMVVL